MKLDNDGFKDPQTENDEMEEGNENGDENFILLRRKGRATSEDASSSEE